MIQSQIPQLPLDILVTDDHPLTVQGHIGIISEILKAKKPKFIQATSVKDAYQFLVKSFKENKPPQLAILDISMPPYPEKNINSGEELAYYIRSKFPKCCIVMVSMNHDPLLVHRIIQKINPDGFMSKSDLDFSIYNEFFKVLELGCAFYSETIKKAYHAYLKLNLQWDEKDQIILQQISKGIKTVHLTKFVPLSLSAIEKRKANIKSQLLFKPGNDSDLIHRAKILGII